MRLARTIKNERADFLLSAGGDIAEARITRLQSMGFLAVYISDGDHRDEIVIRELVADQIHTDVRQRMSSLNNFVAEVEERRTTEAGADSSDVAKRLSDGNQLLHQVADQVQDILDDVLQGSLVVGLSSLKSRDGYAFQHAVDTAAIGALIATKVQLPVAERRSLVTGCLMMDIGNVAVPEQVLASDDHLALAQLGQIQAHSAAGFEIVRSLGLNDVLAAHIPYQHHERQDGLGYPRRLRGLNRVHRSPREMIDGRLILQVAEIAAIADVYDALCSDRPYRAALSIRDAVSTIQELAGSHLNREMVQAPLSLVPIFPLGAHVRLAGGARDGARGIVIEQDRLAPDRPVVRINGDTDAASDAYQIKTSDDPEISLHLLPREDHDPATAAPV